MTLGPDIFFSDSMFQAPYQKIEAKGLFLTVLFQQVFLEEKLISSSCNSKGNLLSQR